MSAIKDYHSMHNPNYHLTLTINSKKKVIADTTSKELEKDLKRINKNYNITLKEWEHDKDHIHVLISGKPNSGDISKFLNSYTTASSRLVKRNHPVLKQSLWKEHYWLKPYNLATTSRVTFNSIKDYVRSQGAPDDTI